jgi:hypothetical protein
LATSFNLENKFFLSSALPENWQKKSRIDLDICRKPALNEGGAMVSRPGFAIAGASIILSPGCRVTKSGQRCQMVKPGQVLIEYL